MPSGVPSGVVLRRELAYSTLAVSRCILRAGTLQARRRTPRREHGPGQPEPEEVNLTCVALLARRSSLLALALCALCVALAPAANSPVASGDGAAPLIPMEDFFRNPEKAGFQLSPNGEYIAFLQPWQSRLNVHVQKIGEEKVTRVTEATERDIMGYAWKGNGRILYVQDKGGDENWRLYAVGHRRDEPDRISPPSRRCRSSSSTPWRTTTTEMLISMNKRDPQLFDVYRINVNTGEMKMIAENPGQHLRVDDRQPGPAAGRHDQPTASTRACSTARARPTPSARWSPPASRSSSRRSSSPSTTPLSMSPAISAATRARSIEYDVEDGKLGELIYEHPEVDVDRLLRSKARKVITGAVYATDRTRYTSSTTQRRRLQEKLETLLPGYEVAVASMSQDETKVLAVTYSDRS